VGVAFLFSVRMLAKLCKPLERSDQQHFAKTKMGYISLPSILNAIIGIRSYCVILKIVILYDAVQTIQIFFFMKKERKPVSLKKKQKN